MKFTDVMEDGAFVDGNNIFLFGCICEYKDISKIFILYLNGYGKLGFDEESANEKGYFITSVYYQYMIEKRYGMI